jgi:cytoskeletal protein CcmA (bactofilin family)
LYNAYLAGTVPFDGTGTAEGYENSSGTAPDPVAMGAYIWSLIASPSNVALWTHEGGVYYPPESLLPLVEYKKDINGDGKDEKVTVPGLSLNGGAIQAKVIVIDGTLELNGNVTIDADVVVVKGDIIQTAGTALIKGTVLVGGSKISAKGNFTVEGSVLAAGSVTMGGNFSVDHTGVGETPFPGGHYEVTGYESHPQQVQAAFLPSGSGVERSWAETVPSAVLN